MCKKPTDQDMTVIKKVVVTHSSQRGMTPTHRAFQEHQGQLGGRGSRRETWSETALCFSTGRDGQGRVSHLNSFELDTLKHFSEF